MRDTIPDLDNLAVPKVKQRKRLGCNRYNRREYTTLPILRRRAGRGTSFGGARMRVRTSEEPGEGGDGRERRGGYIDDAGMLSETERVRYLVE